MIDLKIISNGQKEVTVLAVDDIEIGEGLGYIYGNRSENLWASIYNYEISQQASNNAFLNIPKCIQRFSLHLPVENCELIDEFRIRRQGAMDIFEVDFIFEFDVENWKQSWSIIEFAEAMAFVTKEYSGDCTWVLEDEEIVSNGCCLVFGVEDAKNTIWEEYCRFIPKLKEVYDRATLLLLARSKENSLVMQFDFPEPVRVPCEQYLLYFSEFLREVGIESTTSIQHEMEKVLFSKIIDGKVKWIYLSNN